MSWPAPTVVTAPDAAFGDQSAAMASGQGAVSDRSVRSHFPFGHRRSPVATVGNGAQGGTGGNGGDGNYGFNQTTAEYTYSPGGMGDPVGAGGTF